MVQKVGAITGANVGNLKQLTVPSQTLTYVPKIKVASSGVTDFRLTIPSAIKFQQSHLVHSTLAQRPPILWRQRC